MVLLEEEIEKAERFLFQSKSLRHATGKTHSNSEKQTPRLFPNANRTRDSPRDLLEQIGSVNGSKRGSDSEDEGGKASQDEKSVSGSASEDEIGGLKEEDSDSSYAGSKVKSDNNSEEEDNSEQEVTFESDFGRLSV